MRPTLLPNTAAEALAAVPLSTSIRDVDGPVPPGHRRLVATRLLARRDFDEVADELMRWGMHAGAGLRVAASHIPVESGSLVQLAVGPHALPGLSRLPRLTKAGSSARFGVTVACRIIEVIEEDVRRGFTYATLAGHLESGVQRFTVARDPQGAVRASVVSISAPAHGALRWAGPLPVWAQRVAAARYCAALDT